MKDHVTLETGIMASENSAKYFENSYFKLQYVVADSIVLSAPTYTA